MYVCYDENVNDKEYYKRKEELCNMFNVKHMLELCDIYTALRDEYYDTNVSEDEADKILERLLIVEDELIKNLTTIGIDEKTAKLMIVGDISKIKDILMKSGVK